MRAQRHPERDGFGRRRPAPPGQGRLLVGWPRLVSLLGFSAITAIGVGCLPLGPEGLVIGVFMTLVGGGGLATLAYTRVWVEGSLLLLRMPFRGTRTLHLDRITRASISPFGRNKGPVLSLGDAECASFTIDATNLRLTGLYIVLAQHIRPGGAGDDERLERRLRKHRRSELPG